MSGSKKSDGKMTSFGAVESKEPWFSRLVDRLSVPNNAFSSRGSFTSAPQMPQLGSHSDQEDEGRGSHEFERNTVYWMPDEMATYCYECQVQFSLFVRRHHCRICGRIFCARCSSKRIEGTRVCDPCYDKDTSSGPMESAAPPPPPPPPPTFALPYSRNFQSTDSSQKVPPPPEVSYHLPPQARHFETLVSADYQRVESGGMIEEEWEEGEEESEEEIDYQLFPEFWWEEGEGEGGQGVGMAREGEGEKKEGEDEQSGFESSYSWYLPQNNQSGRRTPKLFRRKSDTDLSRFREGVPDAPSSAAFSPLAIDDLVKTWGRRQTASTLDPLESMSGYLEYSDLHLRLLIKKVVSGCDLPEKWVEVIYHLAVRASEIVCPGVRQGGIGDYMDIRKYIKVCIVPEGDLGDCMYVDGVVFSKNVVHKLMRTNITNPKVLFLDNSVDVDNRGGPRLQSFDILLEQEKHYLQLIVNQIISISPKPDVLVTRSTVSGLAQAYLREGGISVTINNKPQVMNRLSRYTGVDAAPSTEAINAYTPLAELARFKVETYKGQWGSKTLMYFIGQTENQNHSIRFQKLKSGWRESFRRRMKKQARSKEEKENESDDVDRASPSPTPTSLRRSIDTLADAPLPSYPTSSSERREGTIILRGGPKWELSLVKRILLFAIYSLKHLEYEGSFLLDGQGSFVGKTGVAGQRNSKNGNARGRARAGSRASGGPSFFFPVASAPLTSPSPSPCPSPSPSPSVPPSPSSSPQVILIPPPSPSGPILRGPKTPPFPPGRSNSSSELKELKDARSISPANFAARGGVSPRRERQVMVPPSSPGMRMVSPISRPVSPLSSSGPISFSRSPPSPGSCPSLSPRASPRASPRPSSPSPSPSASPSPSLVTLPPPKAKAGEKKARTRAMKDFDAKIETKKMELEKEREKEKEKERERERAKEMEKRFEGRAILSISPTVTRMDEEEEAKERERERERELEWEREREREREKRLMEEREKKEGESSGRKSADEKRKVEEKTGGEEKIGDQKGEEKKGESSKVEGETRDQEKGDDRARSEGKKEETGEKTEEKEEKSEGKEEGGEEQEEEGKKCLPGEGSSPKVAPLEKTVGIEKEGGTKKRETGVGEGEEIRGYWGLDTGQGGVGGGVGSGVAGALHSQVSEPSLSKEEVHGKLTVHLPPSCSVSKWDRPNNYALIVLGGAPPNPLPAIDYSSAFRYDQPEVSESPVSKKNREVQERQERLRKWQEQHPEQQADQQVDDDVYDEYADFDPDVDDFLADEALASLPDDLTASMENTTDTDDLLWDLNEEDDDEDDDMFEEELAGYNETEQYSTVMPYRSANYDAKKSERVKKAAAVLSKIVSYQRIVYAHSACYPGDQSQCTPYQLHDVVYYSPQDIPLGEFLIKYYFDRSKRCAGEMCGKPLVDHERRILHNGWCLIITSTTRSMADLQDFDQDKIYMSSVCKRTDCGKCGPLTLLTDRSYQLSFAKYLELFFYDKLLVSKFCGHSLFYEISQVFCYNNTVVKFQKFPIRTYKVNAPSLFLSMDPIEDKVREIETEELRTVAFEMFTLISHCLTFMMKEYGMTFDEPKADLENCKHQFFFLFDQARKGGLSVPVLKRKLYLLAKKWNHALTTTGMNLRELMIQGPLKKKIEAKRSLNASRTGGTKPRTTEASVDGGEGAIIERGNSFGRDVAKAVKKEGGVESIGGRERGSSVGSEKERACWGYDMDKEREGGETPIIGSSPMGVVPRPLTPQQRASSQEGGDMPLGGRSAPKVSLQLAGGGGVSRGSGGSPGASPKVSPRVSPRISPRQLTPRTASSPMGGEKKGGEDSRVVRAITDGALLASSFSPDREGEGAHIQKPKGERNLVNLLKGKESVGLPKGDSLRDYRQKTDHSTHEMKSDVKWTPIYSQVLHDDDPILNKVPPEKKEGIISLDQPPPSGCPPCEAYTQFIRDAWGLNLPLSDKKEVVPVYPNEVSSMIAYTLSSSEYQTKVRLHFAAFVFKNGVNGGPSGNTTSSLPSPSLPSSAPSEQILGVDLDLEEEGTGEEEKDREETVPTGVVGGMAAGMVGGMVGGVSGNRAGGLLESLVDGTRPGFRSGRVPKKMQTKDALDYLLNVERDAEAHLELQFAKNLPQSKGKFACKVFYAQAFRCLRHVLMGGDEKFIQSLRRSQNWAASGGKSGASWSKSLDGRFILKQISLRELWSFLDVAPQYFQYLSKAVSLQLPTLLAKIYGIYFIQVKRGAKTVKKVLAVMENLFYQKNVTRIFDLKGSLRSRYVEDQSQVLMDENLLNTSFTKPLCINERDKALLTSAIWNDTLLLSSLFVMDYSLVVGIDEISGQYVVGIIDYMRKYTWDKQLETWVKSTGLMGGRGRVPTVISPEQYKLRFRDAMWQYFVLVPTSTTSVMPTEEENQQNKQPQPVDQ